MLVTVGAERVKGIKQTPHPPNSALLSSLGVLCLPNISNKDKRLQLNYPLLFQLLSTEEFNLLLSEKTGVCFFVTVVSCAKASLMSDHTLLQKENSIVS